MPDSLILAGEKASENHGGKKVIRFKHSKATFSVVKIDCIRLPGELNTGNC
jgi:hypothetical protein